MEVTGSLVSSRRLRVALSVGVGLLSGVPVTASAHGGGGDGGASMTFPVVLWVPVVAGLLGGVVAIAARHRQVSAPSQPHVDRVLGLLVLALGGTLAVAALTDDPPLGALGVGVGVLAAATLTGRDQHRHTHGQHARLTLGGICIHRVFEGVALATLYATGVAVGVVGVLVVAGHTALETAAVGGLYAPHPRRAVSAVVVVQLGYALGAVGGVSVDATLPGVLHAVVLGGVAGVLLVVGAVEIRPLVTTGGPAPN